MWPRRTLFRRKCLTPGGHRNDNNPGGWGRRADFLQALCERVRCLPPAGTTQAGVSVEVQGRGQARSAGSHAPGAEASAPASRSSCEKTEQGQSGTRQRPAGLEGPWAGGQPPAGARSRPFSLDSTSCDMRGGICAAGDGDSPGRLGGDPGHQSLAGPRVTAWATAGVAPHSLTCSVAGGTVGTVGVLRVWPVPGSSKDQDAKGPALLGGFRRGTAGAEGGRPDICLQERPLDTLQGDKGPFGKASKGQGCWSLCG